MRSKLTLIVFSRYSLMLCGISHRHCVSRCAYGTTYSVGVFVMSGACIVCALHTTAIDSPDATHPTQRLIRFNRANSLTQANVVVHDTYSYDPSLYVQDDWQTYEPPSLIECLP